MTSIIPFFRSLYSLETLDTRFVTSSNTPAGGKDGAAKASEKKISAGPSRWFTPEFFFYYVMFVLIFPLMVKSPIDASKCESAETSGVMETVETRSLLFEYMLMCGN
jgi:protein-cysteine N-palmitoyltransferase HHAT